MNAVEQFAALAREYRAWVTVGADAGPQAARRALGLVGRLYFAALLLPPSQCEEDEPSEPPPPPSWHEAHPVLLARLPFRYYGEVFNPLPIPPEESIIGDIADDLADIFGDVDKGLRWFKAGRPTEAVWEWNHHLVHHWGDHATSAIRALHCWLASEHPELLAEPTKA